STVVASLARPSQHRASVTRILIADDEPAILELVRFTLENPAVQILEARTGPQALQIARAASPDLVLLDVHMPGMTGVEVCRQLRQEANLAAACIVMPTASGKESARLQGRSAGADEYLTKPFSPLRLIQIARSLLPEVSAWDR